MEKKVKKTKNTSKSKERKGILPKKSPYDIFYNEVKKGVKADLEANSKDKDISGKQITAKISELYKELSEEQMKKYKVLSDMDKTRYQKQHADFKTKGYWFMDTVSILEEDLEFQKSEYEDGLKISKTTIVKLQENKSKVEEKRQKGINEINRVKEMFRKLKNDHNANERKHKEICQSLSQEEQKIEEKQAQIDEIDNQISGLRNVFRNYI